MKIIIVSGLVLFVVIVLVIVILPFFLGVTFSRPVSGGQAENQGLFVSEDGGSTWQARNDIKDSGAKLSGFVITDFVSDPQNRDRLYIGTGNSGIWKSADKGQSWEKVVDKAGILDPRAQILRLQISKSDPRLWFLAVYQKNRGAVLKSEDDGETFREAYFVPVERFGVFDLFYDDATGSVIVVNGQGGLLESRDKGKSWRVVKWFSDGLVGLVVDPRTASTFYVLTSKGKIFKTTNRGAGFVDLSSGFVSFDKSYKNQNLIIDPLSGILYLGSDYGLIRSRDAGISWERVPVIIPPEALPVLNIAVHPNDSRIFFVSAQAQIYKTVDGGISGAIVISPTTRRITKLVIEKSDPNRFYLISNR